MILYKILSWKFFRDYFSNEWLNMKNMNGKYKMINTCDKTAAQFYENREINISKT